MKRPQERVGDGCGLRCHIRPLPAPGPRHSIPLLAQDRPPGLPVRCGDHLVPIAFTSPTPMQKSRASPIYGAPVLRRVQTVVDTPALYVVQREPLHTSAARPTSATVTPRHVP